MDAKYKALLQQTADVVRTKIVTRTNRERTHAVIVAFVKANPHLTYPDIAAAFGLHPVTVNRIALEAGERRGSGRRRTTKHSRASGPAFGKLRTTLNSG
jgi:hypothetical protein